MLLERFRPFSARGKGRTNRNEALAKISSEIAKEEAGKKASLQRLSGACEDAAEYYMR